MPKFGYAGIKYADCDGYIGNRLFGWTYLHDIIYSYSLGLLVLDSTKMHCSYHTCDE